MLFFVNNFHGILVQIISKFPQVFSINSCLFHQRINNQSNNQQKLMQFPSLTKHSPRQQSQQNKFQN